MASPRLRVRFGPDVLIRIRRRASSSASYGGRGGNGRPVNGVEVSGLAQLNAILWDLDGDGTVSDAGCDAAFPNPAAGTGCPIGGCLGCQLTADPDFDGSDCGSSPCWTPTGFGAGIQRAVPVTPFQAVFDGNGHTISNLHMKLDTVISTSSMSHGYPGLFNYAGSDAVICNIGLESVDVSHGPGVGWRWRTQLPVPGVYRRVCGASTVVSNVAAVCLVYLRLCGVYSGVGGTEDRGVVCLSGCAVRNGRWGESLGPCGGCG